MNIKFLIEMIIYGVEGVDKSNKGKVPNGGKLL